MAAPKNNLSEGKHRPHLIPMDLLMELLCPAYEEGIIKYTEESWREGFNHSVMYDACIRHLEKFYFKKESYDPESMELFGIKKHHLGAALFCLISMYNTEKEHPELDDRSLNREHLDHFNATGKKPGEDIVVKTTMEDGSTKIHTILADIFPDEVPYESGAIIHNKKGKVRHTSNPKPGAQAEFFDKIKEEVKDEELKRINLSMWQKFKNNFKAKVSKS